MNYAHEYSKCMFFVITVGLVVMKKGNCVSNKYILLSSGVKLVLLNLVKRGIENKGGQLISAFTRQLFNTSKNS